jgi:hypothetical protein
LIKILDKTPGVDPGYIANFADLTVLLLLAFLKELQASADSGATNSMNG